MMSFRHGLHVRRGGAIVLSSTLLTSMTLVTATAPAEAVSATKIVYKASAAKVYAGTKVTLAGTVSPAKTARTVSLQRYYSRAWHSVATTRTIAGAYKVTVPSKTVGAFTYRLAVPAGAGGARATTRSITLGVIKRPYGGNAKAFRFFSSGSVPAAPIDRWNPCGPAIGYRVNLANSTAGALADVKGAIARVSSATGLTFAYRGSTKILPGHGNDTYPAGTDLVIAWARPGASKFLPKPKKGYRSIVGYGGGYRTSARDAKGRRASMMIEGFVVLNATRKLSAGFGSGPRGAYGTRGQLLMHELGHVVGLDHPIIKDQIQIMAPVMSRRPARWGAGDKNGLRRVGRSAGCMHR